MDLKKVPKTQMCNKTKSDLVWLQFEKKTQWAENVTQYVSTRKRYDIKKILGAIKVFIKEGLENLPYLPFLHSNVTRSFCRNTKRRSHHRFNLWITVDSQEAWHISNVSCLYIQGTTWVVLTFWGEMLCYNDMPWCQLQNPEYPRT